MDWWLLIFVLIVLLAGAIFPVWIFARLVKQGWKDHRWTWDDTNYFAMIFVGVFVGQAVGDWLRGSPWAKIDVNVWAGLGYIAMPYIAYITGRLLGIWHRAPRRQTLS